MYGFAQQTEKKVGDLVLVDNHSPCKVVTLDRKGQQVLVDRDPLDKYRKH